MARKNPPSANSRSRAQNEAELARLAKLRGALPSDRKQAGARMDRRMSELEASLRPKANGSLARTSRLVGLGVILVLVMILGFVGVLTLGHFSGL